MSSPPSSVPSAGVEESDSSSSSGVASHDEDYVDDWSTTASEVSHNEDFIQPHGSTGTHTHTSSVSSASGEGAQTPHYGFDAAAERRREMAREMRSTFSSAITNRRMRSESQSGSGRNADIAAQAERRRRRRRDGSDDDDYDDDGNADDVGDDVQSERKESGNASAGGEDSLTQSTSEPFQLVFGRTRDELEEQERVRDRAVTFHVAPAVPRSESVAVEKHLAKTQQQQDEWHSYTMTPSSGDGAAPANNSSAVDIPRGNSAEEVALTLEYRRRHGGASSVFDREEPLLEGVQLGRELGRGAFGMVFQGVWEGHDVAVKHVSSPDAVREIKAELGVMQRLNHPNIVRVFGLAVFQSGTPQAEILSSGDSDGPGPVPGSAAPLCHYGLILEFCEGGSLDVAVQRHDFSADELLDMCLQTARGLAYLTARGVLHRDLAARNILLDAAGKCKITDFGLSRAIEDGAEYYRVTSSIPVRWTAPEVLSEHRARPASDVYSLGIVMWELFSRGERPYPDLDSNPAVILAVGSGRRPGQPPLMSGPVYDVACTCWQADPASRPAAAAVAKALRAIARGDPADAGDYLKLSEFDDLRSGKSTPASGRSTPRSSVATPRSNPRTPRYTSAPFSGSSSPSRLLPASQLLRLVPRLAMEQHRTLFFEGNDEQLPQNGSDDESRAVRVLEPASCVVFLDIVGFSTLASQLEYKRSEGSESLATHLNEFFDIVVETFSKFGGDVAKFCGDALQVVFADESGAFTRKSSPLRRAVAASWRVQAAVMASKTGLRCKIGIGAGSLHVVSVGDQYRRELLLYGEALEAATHAEGQAGEPGKVSLSKTLCNSDPALARAFSDSTLSPQHKAADVISLEVLSATLQDVLKAAERGSWAPPENMQLSAAQQEVLSSYNLRMASDLPAEMRTLSVLFCMVIMSVQQLVDGGRLHAVVGKVQESVRRFGGDIRQVALDDKGFVIIAVFGLVRREDDCLAAARCASALAAGETPARVGVSRGRVFCGRVGSATRSEVAVVGDVVNLAARLMSKCSPHAAMIDSSTAQELAGNSRSKEIVEVKLFEEGASLKGQPQPVNIYSVQERCTIPAEPSSDINTSWGGSSVVHVHQEKMLTKFISQSDGDAVRSALIVGDAGAGKTTLVRQVLHSFQQQRHSHVISVQGVEMDQYTELFPWRTALQRFRSLHQQDPVDDLTSVAEFIEALRVSLTGVIARHSAQESNDADHVHASSVLLVIEDAHWLDEASLRTLVVILRGNLVLNVPVTVITTSRPGEAYVEGTQDLFEKVEEAADAQHFFRLGTLELSELGPVVASVAKCKSVEPRVLRALSTVTQGNLLMAREVTLALVEDEKLHVSASGELCAAPGALTRGSGDGGELELRNIPRGIEATVQSRIDRLSPDHKTLLAAAAALGNQFDPDLLCDVVNRWNQHPWGVMTRRFRREQVEDLLEDVHTNGILRFGINQEHEFSHSLVRAAVESTLTGDSSRLLHRACALALTEDQGVDEPATLAYHFDLAGDADEAIQNYEKLAFKKLPVNESDPAMIRVLGRLVDLYEDVDYDPRQRLVWWSFLVGARFFSSQVESAAATGLELAAFAGQRVPTCPRFPPSSGVVILSALRMVRLLLIKGRYPEPPVQLEFEVADRDQMDARTWSAYYGSAYFSCFASQMILIGQGKGSSLQMVWEKLVLLCAMEKVFSAPVLAGFRWQHMHWMSMLIRGKESMRQQVHDQRTVLERALEQAGPNQRAVIAPSHVLATRSLSDAELAIISHDFVEAAAAIDRAIEHRSKYLTRGEYEAQWLKLFQALLALQVDPNLDQAHAQALEVLRDDQVALRGDYSEESQVADGVRMFAELDISADPRRVMPTTALVHERVFGVFGITAKAQQCVRARQWPEALVHLGEVKALWLGYVPHLIQPRWSLAIFEFVVQRYLECVADAILVSVCTSKSAAALSKAQFLDLVELLRFFGLPEPVPVDDIQYPLWQADMLLVRAALGEVNLADAIGALRNLATVLKERRMTRGAGRALYIAAVLHHDLHGSTADSALMKERQVALEEAQELFQGAKQTFYEQQVRAASGVLMKGQLPGLSLGSLRAESVNATSQRRRTRYATGFVVMAVVVALLALGMPAVSGWLLWACFAAFQVPTSVLFDSLSDSFDSLSAMGGVLAGVAVTAAVLRPDLLKGLLERIGLARRRATQEQ